MAKISSMLDIGKRTMMNSQAALHTVGHNIANKNTDGYSRQRVETQTNEPIGAGNLRFGMGAKASAVTRVVNPQLEKQIGNEMGSLGYLTGQQEGMIRVEQVYNEQLVEGLSSTIGKFFNSFRELSNNPESIASRTLVTETANFMAKDFVRVNDNLDEVRKDLDSQISVQVTEVNQISREIANLNEKIQVVELSGSNANDERDRRDLLLKNLGEKLNIRWAEGQNGMVTITAGNSAILVAGRDHRELSVASTPADGNKAEGSVDILYNGENKVPVSVTKQFSGGQVGGLLKVRDEFISDLNNGLDEMAYSISQKVNDLHLVGYDGYNKQGGFFFKPAFEVKDASRSMAVHQTILDDSSRIAIAGNINSPGDNTIANMISDLQYKKIVGNDTATLDEHYNSIVGRVGVFSNRIIGEVETQKNVVNQLKNIRESISGVSLDEETAKMIEFQKHFDASARLIKTADEMLETVINLKR